MRVHVRPWRHYRDMQLITVPRFRAHNSLLDVPLYENTSTPYFLQLPTFFLLRHFRLIFAEMSFEIQRHLAAKSEKKDKEKKPGGVKAWAPVRDRTQGNHCRSLFHLCSTVTHVSP